MQIFPGACFALDIYISKASPFPDIKKNKRTQFVLAKGGCFRYTVGRNRLYCHFHNIITVIIPVDTKSASKFLSFPRHYRRIGPDFASMTAL